MQVSEVSIADTQHDRYDDWCHAVALTFEGIPASTPLFRTDAVYLNDAYLDPFGMAGGVRQHYTCDTCRHFLERYGDLVTIDPETGVLSSALWDPAAAPPAFVESAQRLKFLAEKAKVTGVFLSKEHTLGESPKGGYTHFSVSNAGHAFAHPTRSDHQEMAALRERFRLVRDALAYYKPELLADALQILEASKQGRTEVAIGPVRWLLELARKYRAVKEPQRREAIAWRAVAVAPESFCHPNSSVAGTVLQDLLDGTSPVEAMTRFAAKTAPLAYNRPTAAPSEGAIREAEKTFNALGLAPSLSRRAASVVEVLAEAADSVLWLPRQDILPASPPRIFDHVRAAQAEATTAKADLPTEVMTWARFSEEVLPTAVSIQVLVPQLAYFATFVTATNRDAPPILGWDDAERRNRFSWYFIHGGAPSLAWDIHPGWRDVRGIVPRPCHWHDRSWPKHTPAAYLVISAPKIPDNQLGYIFPAHLASHLKPYDSVVEAHSKASELVVPTGVSGYALAVCVDERNAAAVRVDSGGRNCRVITIDRWK